MGLGQSCDVEPGGHDEQGQGRTTFHQFMQIWVFFVVVCFVFVGHTARADIAARSLFVSSAYVGYEVGLNKMADAGQE